MREKEQIGFQGRANLVKIPLKGCFKEACPKLQEWLEKDD